MASVSIFYPCYNDWGTMGSMVMLTIRTAERLGLDYDITLIDDGSGDHTLDLLEEIERHFPQVHVKRHEANRGYGGALRSGFASATKEWIFYTDGDAQYDVRELDRLLWLAIGGAREDYLDVTPELEAELGEPVSTATEASEVDASAIERALLDSSGNISAAARALGLRNRYVLLRLIKKHGVDVAGTDTEDA